jgi:hypothetical protein
MLKGAGVHICDNARCKRTGGQHGPKFRKDAERDRDELSLTRGIPITAVEQFLYTEATVHHHSTLTIPEPITPQDHGLPSHR